MLNLEELIPRCHQAARANGWWKNLQPIGTRLMLIVSELSEAMEADRKGHFASLPGYERAITPPYAFDDEQFRINVFRAAFIENVKDSVEDELADALIRICDLAGGASLSAQAFQEEADQAYAGRLTLAEELSIPEGLFCITHHVTRAAVGCRQRVKTGPLTDAVGLICALAKREGFDLARHIDLKLAYNATRGHKHGGKAY